MSKHLLVGFTHTFLMRAASLGIKNKLLYFMLGERQAYIPPISNKAN